MSDVKGLNKVLKKLAALEKNLAPKIDNTLDEAARQVEKKAKRNNQSGPNRAYDIGTLNRSIGSKKIDELHYRIAANTTGFAPYAPYIEFGTGGLVSVPAELKDLAIRFKGAGVKQVNLRARPFLYPAFKEQRKTLIKDLEVLLEKELDK